MSTKPLPIWSSSKKDWSDWSMVPAWRAYKDVRRFSQSVEGVSTISFHESQTLTQSPPLGFVARTVTLPAHEEQAPARHEYGRSMPASCATREETRARKNRQSMRARRTRVHRTRVQFDRPRDDGWISTAIAIHPARDSNAFAPADATVLRIGGPRDGWTHTQKKICLARRRVSSRLESSLARVSRRAYLGRVEDVRVVRALDRLRALRGFQGDGVSREDGAAGDLGAGGATRGDADRRADRGGGGDGESGHDSG